MKIQKLPIEVSSKLQSGIIVTDAVQCVLELVYNSLDAEATGIAVRINLKTYQIQVIDNGKGIAKEDLALVAERFMTSKFQSSADKETSFPTYGYKGQALSSLQQLSRTLRIESKSEDDGPTYVKVFQNNTALPITTTENEKTGTGTSIFIDDFMYTMPVRRKRINEMFVMEEIKNQLQYLAIVHFRVCFTLRNESKSLIILQIPQASSILESLTNIYGKPFAQCLKTLNYQEKKYDISGYFSLKPQNQNNIQLIYVNKRIITRGVIHKFINNLIKEYNRKEIMSSESPATKILRSLKSTCNAFIIEIKCPRAYYELFTNVRKTKIEFKNWKVLLKCIHKALRKVYKDIMNLESSSNNQHDDDEDKAETCKDNRVFGTSFLINAIRGAPAKRELCSRRDSENRKKIKTNDNWDLSKSSENKKAKLNTKNQVKECQNDSMESPIPKKSFKNKTMALSNSKQTKSYNQSFVEFYDWLKTKLETDTNAFNLYNDFLQCKNKEVTKFKSPVFGRKLKRKQTLSPQKLLEKKQKKNTNDLFALDEQMAIMSQKQLKIIPNGHLRMKKAVQFVSEGKSNLPESENFDFIRDRNVSFEEHNIHSVFKKPEDLLIVDRNQKQVECNHILPSLPSSEVQFTNIIKFRNLSESFFSQSRNAHIFSEKTFSPLTSNTWPSHYENFESNNLEFHDKGRNMKNYVSWLEVNERNKTLGLLDFCNFSKVGLLKLARSKTETEALQDAEVQVNTSEISFPVEKVNAVVQTCQKVPECQSFENSYTFNQANDMHCIQIGSSENQTCNDLEGVISQEPLNHEFWNTSFHMSLNKTNISEFCSNINKINEKNSASNEYICGHKSNCSWKNQNERFTSKETQTLAAIWTDSLTKIVFPANCDGALNSKLTNSKSETTQLPKTIPLEQLHCDNLQSIEPEFCLTERHDFIPKGLSPTILNQDSARVFSLSPGEKKKIQLTISSTKNEFLANVKWQDEFTDDYLKPTIPDVILFEMRRKSEESAPYYENPVLSASLSYCAVKIHNLLHSFAFTKELLSTVEILGQLDKKFIVTKMKISAPRKMELISLFDQHAVDERIKLEELIAENILPNGNFISSCLDPPVHCILIASDVRAVFDLKERIFNFGLNVEPVNETTISVKEIPTFLLNKHEKDLKNKKETSLSVTLKVLIMNIINEIRETRGAVPKTPKIIHNAFCLEACHKAIKFNKALSIETMTEMINKLQSCKLPFQCAHGRPSVIPIIDLEDFKPMMEENEKSFDLQEIKNFFDMRKNVENLETV